MKIIFKVLFLMLIIDSTLYSGSVFTLSGIKKVHPIVKINTKKIPKNYKKMILQEIKINLDDLKINYTDHNKRIFTILVNSYEVGNSSIIDVELRICEQVKRINLDGKSFAVTYISKEYFLLNKDDDLEDLFEDALDTLLNRFSEQYEEENKAIKLVKINEENFAAEMKYETSYKKAVKKAKRLKKNIMFVLVSNHCPWCRKFEQRVLLKKDVNDLIQNNYIPLILNKSTDKFPKKYNKAISPIVYFIDYKSLENYETTIGYNSRDEFLHILRKNNSDCF